MDVMEEVISNCRRSVADRDEPEHDLPPRLCNAVVRPVKLLMLMLLLSTRGTSPLLLVEVWMDEADVVG